MDIILANNDTSWEVTSLVESPPVNVFRHVISLSFATGGYADNIQVNSDAGALDGVFTPQEYDTLDVASPIHATKADAPNKTVIITLDAPRNIKKIRILGLEVDKIELYRVDGEAIADEPTYTVSNNEEIEDFVTTKFAIKVIDESQTYANLTSTYVQDVIVQSNPTGPRIGIAAPVQEGETRKIIEYFWNVAGEITELADTVPADKNPSEELAKALTRYLNDQFSTIFSYAEENEQLPDVPDNINIDLVLESDTPCNFDASQFKINYAVVRQQSSFPYQGVSPQEKTVVRFSGNALCTEEITVELPKNANVISASLKTEASLGGVPSYIVGTGMEPLTTSNRTGINIVEDRWIAKQILPGKAIRINGLALGLMNLEKETELLVELQEDWNGQPSGKKLAEAQIHLSILGERTWSRIPLRDSIPLATQPYWILLKSAKGTALWFTRSGDFEPVQVLKAAQEKAPLTKITAINGVDTYYKLFSCCPHSQTQQAPYELAIDDTTIPPTSIEKDTISFDIKDALNNKLSLAEGEGLASITLHLRSAFPGLVTVYCPRIVYTVDQV